MRLRITLLATLCLRLLSAVCDAQGTIGFDGPPVQPPGSAYTVQFYYEAGMQFLPLSGSDGFGRVWSNPPAFLPNNGTPYLDASAGEGLIFDFSSGAQFNLQSVDLAGYSTVVPDFSVEFVGHLSSGGTVSTAFSGTGIHFQTFTFGPEWTGLTSVEIPNDAWSLDNVVVSVPEPSAASLVIVSAFTSVLFRRKRL